MPVALTFTGNIDPTALATFVLAVATFLLVLVGWRTLRQTRSAIDLARKEVEEAHRPIVIPIRSDDVVYFVADWGQIQAKPYCDPSVGLAVALKNLGTGPALDVAVEVVGRDDAGEYSEGWGDQIHRGYVHAIGVSSVVPVVVRVPGLQRVPSFEITVIYADVAGKKWRTAMKYHAPYGGWYAEPEIVPVATDDSATGLP